MELRIYSKDKQAHLPLTTLKKKDHSFPPLTKAEVCGGGLDRLSWAYVKEDFYIPVHPYKGFELFTYVIKSQNTKGDALDGHHHVKSGDLLILHSGNTTEDVEKIIGPDFEAFQFWFALDGVTNGMEVPDYQKIKADQFDVKALDGVLVTNIIGSNTPVYIRDDMRLMHIEISSDHTFEFQVEPNRIVGFYVIKGKGTLNADHYNEGDFVEISRTIKDFNKFQIKSASNHATNIMFIDMLKSEF